MTALEMKSWSTKLSSRGFDVAYGPRAGTRASGPDIGQIPICKHLIICTPAGRRPAGADFEPFPNGIWPKSESAALLFWPDCYREAPKSARQNRFRFSPGSSRAQI